MGASTASLAEDYSPNDDVWDVRWRRQDSAQGFGVVAAGVNRIGAVRRLPAGDETVEVWSALDALVLKAIALVLTAHWLPKLSPHCYHIEGRGGAKAAVCFVNAHRADSPFVFRTGRAAGRHVRDGVDVAIRSSPDPG